MKSIHHLFQLHINATDRILVIMPHPDDEAVFISGLLHKFSTSGIPTRVLVMTRGEKSTLRYGLKPADDLATVRNFEQRLALKTLGMGDYQIFKFPDGGLESKTEELTATIKSEITSFHPTILVTLEPDGIYGHPDHIALTKVVDKFHTSSRRVLYATLAPRHILPSSKHMAKKKIITPLKPEYQLHFSPTDILVKLKAISSHRSQLHPLYHPSAFLFFFANRLLTSEFFVYSNLKTK